MTEQQTAILSSLDWAAASEDYEPSTLFCSFLSVSFLFLLSLPLIVWVLCFYFLFPIIIIVETNIYKVRAPTEAEDGQYRSQGQKERYERRKLAIEALEVVREELFAGEWDGSVIKKIVAFNRLTFM